MVDATRRRRRVLARYLEEIRELPPVSREEEGRLVREFLEGDSEARNRLVESNLGFVVRVAKEYRNLGLPFEDLLNEGNLGLIEAARRFDPGRGTKFITYAIWWIRKSILGALSNKAPLVRLPYNQTKRAGQVRRAAAELSLERGEEPSREDIARHLGMRVTDVERAVTAGTPAVRLDASTSDESRPLVELLEDLQTSSEERLIKRQASVGAARAFRHLSGRERTVLALRFGLTGRPPMTLRAVGEAMGLSRERVRQIESRGKERLRRRLQERSGRADAGKGPHRARRGRRRETSVERDRTAS